MKRNLFLLFHKHLAKQQGFWHIYHLKSQRITEAATANPAGPGRPAPNFTEIHPIC